MSPPPGSLGALKREKSELAESTDDDLDERVLPRRKASFDAVGRSDCECSSCWDGMVRRGMSGLELEEGMVDGGCTLVHGQDAQSLKGPGRRLAPRDRYRGG